MRRTGPPRRLSRSPRALVASMSVCLLWLAVVSASASATGPPFRVGLQDPGFTASPSSPAALFAVHALKAVHGSTIRIPVNWGRVAPDTPAKPAGFDATNAAAPGYNWTTIDAALRAAAQLHEKVVLYLIGVPLWATGPNRPGNVTWDPNPQDFGQFANAAASRYGGHFADPIVPGAELPRVKLWEIGNEDNLPEDLQAPNPVETYRRLLNAAYGAIKAVHHDNVVAVGGLAPVSFHSNSISPLKFAADLLCLRRIHTHFVSAGNCPAKAHFDVLGIHPYSLDATPTKHASKYDDVLVADLGKMQTLIRTADRLHTTAPRIKHQLWVTEWSWFTNPPDTAVGDPPNVAARYTAYSMYEMWRSRVSLIIWFLAQDPATGGVNSPQLVFGGGLYTSAGVPKPMMQAFRFPVVAGVTHGRGFVWGRAPVSGRVRVAIAHKVGHRWKRIGTARTSSDGVFDFHFAANRNGTYRASAPHGDISQAYDSTPIPRARTH